MSTALRRLVPIAHVRSVAASIPFYEKIGFRVLNVFTPPEAAEPSWVWLESEDNAALMLGLATDPVVAAQQAVLFCLYFDDVAAKHAELQEAGIDVTPIVYPFYNRGGEFRVTDPDGYVLMMAHAHPA